MRDIFPITLSHNVGLSVWRRSRQAVADVEDLKKKIEELTQRSGALENALRTLFAAVSDEPHPLLRDSASPNGGGPSASASDSPRTESSFEGPSLTADEEDALDAFGTSKCVRNLSSVKSQ